MVDKDVTELFSPVSDGDVVRMHGQMWRVCLRCPVRIEEITEPGGGNLAAANWRSSYAGVVGRATFADDVDDTGRSVGRCAAWPTPARAACARPTTYCAPLRAPSPRRAIC